MIKKVFLKSPGNYVSKWIVLIIDILLVCFSFIIASIIFHSDFSLGFKNLYYQIPPVIIFSSLSFLLVGSYSGIIRHTGAGDAFNILIATFAMAMGLALLIPINYFFDTPDKFRIPLSVIVIHYLLNNFILIISRLVFRFTYKAISTKLNTTTTALIYGAGHTGIVTYEALNNDIENCYEVVGFIDDDKQKIGKKINRLKIYGLHQITPDFIAKKHIDEIIISLHNIDSDRILKLSDKLLLLGLKVKIVPPFSKWIESDFRVNQIKQVRIEDLLDRKPIAIDNPIVQRDVNNKVILITGAAGTIGGEISRQLSLYNYKHLVLVDRAESDLYNLQQELLLKKVKNITFIVADIRDNTRMEAVFVNFKPNKLFHAAAYKHVPLMETTPYEAVKVNVEGTKIIADLSVKYEVERFIMISTDKAVNPTNVMGATKRIAEMYISYLSKQNNSTKFTITRFGNVMGSTGSVIPLFKKQIENGGPITVTHKDVIRYFMTITEACQLVLEAGTMGKGGEIYIFDMGKPVKIFEVAKKMILLSGLQYPTDIDIKIIGLRPGEKLYEELLANGENTQKTYHEKILIAKDRQLIGIDEITRKIKDLCTQNHHCDNNTTVKLMKVIVPEYKSNNSEYEKLD